MFLNVKMWWEIDRLRENKIVCKKSKIKKMIEVRKEYEKLRLSSLTFEGRKIMRGY